MSNDAVPSPRIRVHDAVLYTQLMNAADWSRTIEREQKRRRLTLRRQIEAEQLQVREEKRLEGAQLLAAQDTAFSEAQHQKQLREKAQTQEMVKFRRRIENFMREHKELIGRCAFEGERSLVHRQRVFASLSRAWEDEVLRPVQESIEAQMDDTHGERQRRVMRHEMMSSFIAECNRVKKLGGQHAVFLDLIDEVQYNPLQQLQSCAILYPTPHKKIAVDVHRQEARDVQRKYAQLALDYRGLAHESTTGVLSGGKPLRMELPASTSFPTTIEARSAAVKSFDTTVSAFSPESLLLGATVVDSSESKLCGLQGTRAETTGSTKKSQETREVMPLPLVHGADADSHDSLAFRLLAQRAPKPRSHYLPVRAWDRFTETMYGWGATADGDVKPFCERHMDSAWMMQRSNVMFDHYTFPRGLTKPIHTGKRVV